MFCLYIEKKSNVVFWFSQKAGCTYVKGLYLRYLGIDKLWPHQLPEQNLPNTNLIYNGQFKSPVHILFIRNPYKRIVSGFLDKLTWKPDLPNDASGFNTAFDISDDLCFEDFINELPSHRIFKNEHFSPQTTGAYDASIHFNGIYDIENIDRAYLDRLFGSTADEPRFKGYFTIYKPYDDPKLAYKLTIEEINQMNYKPDYREFYSPDIKQKVAQLFAGDFQFFEQSGFDFDIH